MILVQRLHSIITYMGVIRHYLLMQKDFFFHKSHRIQSSVMKTWDSCKSIFTIARLDLSQEFINMVKITYKDPICSNL